MIVSVVGVDVLAAYLHGVGGVAQCEADEQVGGSVWQVAACGRLCDDPHGHVCWLQAGLCPVYVADVAVEERRRSGNDSIS